MELRRRVTGALAWAGLVLIVAVPSVELVRDKLFAKSAMTVTTAKAEAPAVVVPIKAKPKPAVVVASTPVAPQPAVKPMIQPAAPSTVVASTTPPVESGGDAVKDYLAANKKLPDYITGSTSTAPAAQVPAQQLPTALPGTGDSAATASPAPVFSAPAGGEPAADQPTDVATIDAQPVVPDVPPIPMPATARPRPQAVGQTITEADLKDWKSGTLEDYLRAHGLLADGADNGDSGGVPAGGY